MKVKLAFAGLIALLMVGSLAVTAALAHSRPVRFDPAPGSVLQSPPGQVTGWFTADLRRDPSWSFIHVADPQGARADTGDPVLSPDRRQMTANLKPALAPGRYVVTWRTFDDTDNAIFGDCFTFFVGQAAADKAAADGSRLDGGGDCQRLELDASKGTPTAGQLAKALAVTDETAANDENDNDVPLWALAAGVIGGLAIGGLGGRYLRLRP